MLEWVLVIVTVFNIFFGANRTVYHGQQEQVRHYQSQGYQAVATPYGTPGGQGGYYYGQPPQATAYPQEY